MSISVLQFEMRDEQATLDVGARLAQGLPQAPACFLVTLIGDLGAGKTTLVRGMLRGLGYLGRVKSPTYPLLEQYALPNLAINHFDLYRLEAPEAFSEAGFEETLSQSGVSLIEWPDRAQSLLPPVDWQVGIETTTREGRMLTLTAQTNAGLTALAGLKAVVF